MENKPIREEPKRKYEESVRQMIAAFPYERMEGAGGQALAAWANLRHRVAVHHLLR